jgi:hypothetical protein
MVLLKTLTLIMHTLQPNACIGLNLKNKANLYNEP